MKVKELRAALLVFDENATVYVCGEELQSLISGSNLDENYVSLESIEPSEARFRVALAGEIVWEPCEPSTNPNVQTTLPIREVD